MDLPLRSGLIRDGDRPYLKRRIFQQRISQEANSLSVDLFVRTFHARLPELLVLLRSVRAFWPSAWGVVVVFDGSPDDVKASQAACSLLTGQARLRCVLEDKPDVYERFPGRIASRPGSAQRARGYAWHVWSMLHADQHVTAEYVALMDTDAVLMSFALPRLLFAPEKNRQGRPRPVIFGQGDIQRFPRSLRLLGLPRGPEFMDAMPMVIRREHFAALRAHIVLSHGNNFWRNTSAQFASALQAKLLVREPQDPDEIWRRRVGTAFASLLQNLADESGSMDTFCIQSALGGFLLSRFEDDYAWVMRHGFLSEQHPKYSCPRLRAGYHLSYWGDPFEAELANWGLRSGYQVKSLRHFGMAGHGPADSYTLRAEQLVNAGLCAVPWFQRVSKRPRQEAVSQGFQALDAGWRDVRRELCGDVPQASPGMGPRFTPILGANLSDDRLLSATFPAQAWTDEEAKHCGELKPSILLRDYRRLMNSLAYLVD